MKGVTASIGGALKDAGITQQDVGRTVSTGYGRRMLDVADKNYTEITCHARGAVAMVPDARPVIDIGGQDSKVISVDANGLVAQFAKNDRCAAGTGKFLEVLARAMQIDLSDMGEIALQAQNKLKISSMCATFAETEAAWPRIRPPSVISRRCSVCPCIYRMTRRLPERSVPHCWHSTTIAPRTNPNWPLPRMIILSSR